MNIRYAFTNFIFMGKVGAFHMKVNVSDPKLASILQQKYSKDKVDKKLVADFRNWLNWHISELGKDEREADILGDWLIDMARYFKQMKRMKRV